MRDPRLTFQLHHALRDLLQGRVASATNLATLGLAGLSLYVFAGLGISIYEGQEAILKEALPTEISVTPVGRPEISREVLEDLARIEGVAGVRPLIEVDVEASVPGLPQPASRITLKGVLATEPALADDRLLRGRAPVAGELEAVVPAHVLNMLAPDASWQKTQLHLRYARTTDGTPEAIRIAVRVVGVLKSARADAALVPLDLAMRLDAWGSHALSRPLPVTEAEPDACALACVRLPVSSLRSLPGVLETRGWIMGSPSFAPGAPGVPNEATVICRRGPRGDGSLRDLRVPGTPRVEVEPLASVDVRLDGVPATVRAESRLEGLSALAMTEAPSVTPDLGTRPGATERAHLRCERPGDALEMEVRVAAEDPGDEVLLPAGLVRDLMRWKRGEVDLVEGEFLCRWAQVQRAPVARATLFLEDADDGARVLDELAARGLRGEDRLDEFRSLRRLAGLIAGIVTLMVGGSLLNSGANVFTSTSLRIQQRSREIGILKSAGFTRGSIIGVYFLQGLLLGGVASGLATGAYLLLSVPLCALARDVLGVACAPPATLLVGVPWLGPLVLLLLVVFSLTGTVPAWLAARRSPAAAFRGAS